MMLWHFGLRRLNSCQGESITLIENKGQGRKRPCSLVHSCASRELVPSQEKELCPNFISVLVTLNLSENFLSAKQNPPAILGIFELVLSYCN